MKAPGIRGSVQTVSTEVAANDRRDLAPTPSQNQPRRDPRNGRIRYVTLWINEMRGHVASLSPAARGAYLSLLLEYLTQQGPLEHDNKLLIRICGVPKRDWPGIFIELLGVFDLVNGELVDEYADHKALPTVPQGCVTSGTTLCYHSELLIVWGLCRGINLSRAAENFHGILGVRDA